MSRNFTALLAAVFVLLGACRDGVGPPPPPPELTAVSPASVQWGATGVTLTVTGTGFREESVVRWDNTALVTTYVSRTELRAVVIDALLQAGGAHAVVVSNPEPGGGTTTAQAVTVNYAAPAVASLSTDTTTVGQAVTVIATGTGFTPETQVMWDGETLPTTYISPTQVSFAARTGVAGVFAVAVRNPAPGGGTSATRPFSVLNPVPVITMLPSYGATAGRPGFTLTVHGTGFVAGSTAIVNGQARGATFVSSTRLQVPVSSAELAAPGTITVAVENAGPTARRSSTVSLTVRTLGAATATVQRRPLDGNDIAWDAGTGRLYLSFSAGAGALGNTVSAVDPATGTVTGSVGVGSEPGRMALSDNGQYLYVGLNGEGAIRRVEIASLTAGLQWSIGAGKVAGDLAVVPGQPLDVVVSIHNPGSSPPLAGVQLYADGAARGSPSPGHTGGDRIEFLESPSTLFGFNNSSSGWAFYTMAVDAAGVRHVHETGGLLSGYYTDIVGASGRVYGFDGSVVDAGQRTRVGTFGSFGWGLAADPATGRVFLLTDSGIRVYDMNTFQHLGTLPVAGYQLPHPAGLASRVVRWGTDGLAFLDEDELFIVRSPLVAP